MHSHHRGDIETSRLPVRHDQVKLRRPRLRRDRRSHEVLITRVQQGQRWPNLLARSLMKLHADQYDISDQEFH